MFSLFLCVETFHGMFHMNIFDATQVYTCDGEKINNMPSKCSTFRARLRLQTLRCEQKKQFMLSVPFFPLFFRPGKSVRSRVLCKRIGNQSSFIAKFHKINFNSDRIFFLSLHVRTRCTFSPANKFQENIFVHFTNEQKHTHLCMHRLNGSGCFFLAAFKFK